MRITLTIKPVGRPALTATFTAPGWRYISGSLGAHLFDCGGGVYTLRISDGVYDGDGAGTVAIEYANVASDGPMSYYPQRYVVGDSQLVTIGGLTQCLPVRSSYAFDFALGKPASVIYDRMPRVRANMLGSVPIPHPARHLPQYQYADRWLTCLRTGTTSYDSGLTDQPVGMWQWLEWAQCYQPGGRGITPFGGYEKDSATSILRARLTMRRAFIDCLSATTGEPVSDPARFPEGYTLVRGPYPSTTLPFSHTRTSPTRTAPRTWNDCGGVAGFQKLHGASRDGDVNPPDNEHLIRLFEPLYTATRFYGDPCAAFDLRMATQEIEWTMRKPMPSPKGQGSSWYGRRGWAWPAFGLERGGLERLATQHAKMAANAQMLGNGQICRMGSDNGDHGDAWGNVPNWWRGDGGRVLPLDVDGGATMEAFFSMLVLGAADLWNEAEALVAGIFLDSGPHKSVLERNGWDVPKAVGVAQLRGPTFRAIDEWMGGGDYFDLFPPGVMALCELHTGGDPDKWLVPALRLPPPSTPRPSYTPADTLKVKKAKMINVLYADPAGLMQTAPLIAALEATL